VTSPELHRESQDPSPTKPYQAKLSTSLGSPSTPTTSTSTPAQNTVDGSTNRFLPAWVTDTMAQQLEDGADEADHIWGPGTGNDARDLANRLRNPVESTTEATERPGCWFGACPRLADHTPCCSSHGHPLCDTCYRRSHFVGLPEHTTDQTRPVVGLVAHGLDLDAVELDAGLAAGMVVRGEGVQGRLAEARAAGRRLFAAVPGVVAEVRRLRAQVATQRPPAVREQAIEAAATRLRTTHWDGNGCGTNGTNGCSRCCGPSPADAREVAAEVLAAAVPALLNDLADRIAKLASYNCELRYDGTEDPEVGAWVQGIHNAHDLVRAAAEGWTE
jgi:hypothetical protein